MSKYNRSFLNAYKHLNTSGTEDVVADMEQLADLVLQENYGLHRLLSAVHRKSHNYNTCANNDHVRDLIEEIVEYL